MLFKSLAAMVCILFIQTICASQTITPSGSAGFCPGSKVTLTALGGTGYQWLRDEVNISGANKASVDANVAGDYKVKITRSGKPDTVIGPVKVMMYEKPAAGFNIGATSCASIPVQFTNTSTGDNLKYDWNFGDLKTNSNNSTAKDPLHDYIGNTGNGNQTFVVKLLVTNAAGCKDSLTKSLILKQSPDATLGGTGKTTYENQQYFTQCGNIASDFTFTNPSTTNNTSYLITWGDMTDNYSVNGFTTTSHKYNVGNFQMSYVVTGTNGCVATMKYAVFVGSNPGGSISSPSSTQGCTGDAFSFPFANVSNNPIGTQYIVQVDDGSAQTVFNQPPPLNYTHTFDKPSCPNGNGNSFTVSYDITNPCSSTPGTIGGIRISQKPDARFEFLPKDTACVNTDVQLINQSPTIYNVSSNGICVEGKYIWKVSPGGAIVKQGSYGNDFGLADPSAWTSGSKDLTLSFSAPGIYTVSLRVGGNTLCGSDEVIKTICVNPSPTGSFTLDKVIGCAPLQVTPALTTNTPNCGTYSYQWSIDYTPTSGCSPSVSDVTFLNGTGLTSKEPAFQFNNPGVYEIGATITAPAGSCTAIINKQTITVKDKPVISSLVLPNSICEGGTVSPILNSGCYLDESAYSWTFAQGNPGTSSVLDPGSVLYNISGTFPVTVSVTNTCGITETSKNLTVNPTPAVSGPRDTTLCSGTLIDGFQFSSSNGASITWANSNSLIGLSASGFGNINSFTASNPTDAVITATITVTAKVGECNKSYSFSITVNPKPPVPTVTPDIAYCIGSSADSLSATGTGTILWYPSSSGGTGSTIAPLPQTLMAGLVNYYVSSKTEATGCESDRAMISVTIRPVPKITDGSFINPVTCGSKTGSITLKGLIANSNYTVHYTRNNIVTEATASSDSQGNLVLMGLDAGEYKAVSVELNSCLSNYVGPFSLQDPVIPAAPVANADVALCSGNTFNLSATSSLQGTLSYTWYGPDNFTSSVANPVITNATTAAAGTYLVTVTVNQCTSLPDTVEVIVNPTPAQPAITTNSPVCSGNDIILKTVAAAGLTYSWTGPGSFSNTTADITISDAAPANSGTYHLTVTSVQGNCPSPAAQAEVTVEPTPVIASSSFTDPLKCGSSTGSIRLAGLTAGLSYRVYYNKTSGLPDSTVLIADADGLVTLNALSAGTYTNIFVSLNGCPSNSIAEITLTDPDPPAAPVAAGASPLCTGDAIALFATPNINQPVEYRWSGPANYSSTSQNPVITPGGVSNSGKYYVRVILSNCLSLPDSVSIEVNPRPADPVVSYNSPVCREDSLKLRAVSETAGDVSYTWTGPNGFTSTEQYPVIPKAGLEVAGEYSAVAKLLNCFSPGKGTATVTIKPKPDISSFTVNNPTSCGTYTGSIVLEGFASNTAYNLSYAWNGAPAQVSTLSNPVGAIVIANLPAGEYTAVTVAEAGCPSNPLGPLRLVNVPATIPVVGSMGSLCEGDTLQLTSALAVSGTVSYEWVGPNGFTSSLQNPVIAGVTPEATGSYTVTTTLNGCRSSNATDVVVSPFSKGGFSGIDSTVCLGINTGLINVVDYTGSVRRWESSINNGAGWNTITNTTPSLIYTDLTETTLYRAVIASGVCPVDYSTPTKVTVVSKVDDAVAGSDQRLCNEQVTNLIANNPTIGRGRWLQVAGPAAIISNPDNATTAVTGLLPDQEYRFRWTITGAVGCGSSAAETDIINRPAVTAANAGGDINICNFTNTRAIKLGGNAIRTFEKGLWSILAQPAPSSASLSNPSILAPTFTFSQPGIYKLVWTISNDVAATCGFNSDTLTITAYNPPKADFTITPSLLCTGDPVSVSNTSVNANTYQWFWGDGDTSSFVSGTHSYNMEGNFMVKLVAKSVAGTSVCLDSVSHSVATIKKIAAAIQVAGGKACVPYNLSLTALNTTGATDIKWIIYDHALNPAVSYAATATAAHTYNFPGTDSVKLVVNNTPGCADTATYKVKIYSVPISSFAPVTLSTCSHDTLLTYNATTSNTNGDPVSYRWFINGSLSGNTNPFIYRLLTPAAATAAINYQVQLLAQNDGFCGDTALPGKVTVLPLPVVGIKVLPFLVQQQPDYTFTFADTAAAAQTRYYLWDVGDRSGQTRGDRQISYTYSDTGIFKVTVLATDAMTGCQNKDSAQVQVEYIPGYLHVPNAICPGCTANEVRQFLPLGKGLGYYRLRIYTTWGQKIFETMLLNPDGSPKEAWNGKVDNIATGKGVQQDTYRWEIEARFVNGTEWRGMVYPNSSSKRVKSGFLTIIK